MPGAALDVGQVGCCEDRALEVELVNTNLEVPDLITEIARLAGCEPGDNLRIPARTPAYQPPSCCLHQFLHPAPRYPGLGYHALN